MTGRITRRVALRIFGAGLALPLGAFGLRALRDAPRSVRWEGEVLGGLASMTLWHPNPAIARRAIARMQIEVARLENVFSLYRPNSEIVRLNRDGMLGSPSTDLVHVLALGQRFGGASMGAFDPTIQPLWRLHAQGAKAVQDPARLERVRALVDYRALSANRRAIRLGNPDMEISLNGIAQGYITDRITEILGNDGFETAMIDLGETRALGSAPDGAPFSVGLIDPAVASGIDRDVPLANAALSVSGGYGMRFDTTGRHHILDPRSGESAQTLTRVAVISPKAVWADALSTAIYVAGSGAAKGLLAAYPGSRAILSRSDGTSVEV